jgi:hypothetical protein
LSPSNFATYAGNVTDNCQTNGSWYIDACGPWGAELLPYAQWRSGRYTAGVAEMDARIFDSYASAVIDLSERIGSGRDATFAQFVQAAHQWQSVDPLNMKERALAFVYHSCRNMRAEAKENGLVYDTPEKYHQLDGGSVGRTASHFLYDTYARKSNTYAHAHTHKPANGYSKQYFPPSNQSSGTIAFHSSPSRSHWSSPTYRNSTRLPLVAGAAGSSTRSSLMRAGGCTTWATSSARAARTRSSARRTRSSA